MIYFVITLLFGEVTIFMVNLVNLDEWANWIQFQSLSQNNQKLNLIYHHSNTEILPLFIKVKQINSIGNHMLFEYQFIL